MHAQLAEEIRREARALGFVSVGVAPAVALPPHQRAFRRFVAEGRHAGMAYLAREPERREDPRRLLPGAKTVIALAWAYHAGDHGLPPETPSGKIARYAWGPDYHHVIEPRLQRLRDFVLSRCPDAHVRCAVDHAPILERAYAQEAGLGFIGKHTLLITPEHGSWVVLAELITDLDLPCDAPAVNQCAACTRCLDACPTGALTGAFQLDAGRCIAYLTIEHKGDIPDSLKPLAGDWLFGCDICQEVCPYNSPRSDRQPLRFSPPSSGEQGVGAEAVAGPGPWLAIEEASRARSRREFAKRFAGTALLRSGPNGLARNAAVVRNNLGPQDRASDGVPNGNAQRGLGPAAAGNAAPSDMPSRASACCRADAHSEF